MNVPVQRVGHQYPYYGTGGGGLYGGIQVAMSMIQAIKEQRRQEKLREQRLALINSMEPGLPQYEFYRRLGMGLVEGGWDEGFEYLKQAEESENELRGHVRNFEGPRGGEWFCTDPLRPETCREVTGIEETLNAEELAEAQEAAAEEQRVQVAAGVFEEELAAARSENPGASDAQISYSAASRTADRLGGEFNDPVGQQFYQEQAADVSGRIGDEEDYRVSGMDDATTRRGQDLDFMADRAATDANLFGTEAELLMHGETEGRLRQQAKNEFWVATKDLGIRARDLELQAMLNEARIRQENDRIKILEAELEERKRAAGVSESLLLDRLALARELGIGRLELDQQKAEDDWVLRRRAGDRDLERVKNEGQGVEDAWQVALRGLGLDEQRIEDAWQTFRQEHELKGQSVEDAWQIAVRGLGLDEQRIEDAWQIFRQEHELKGQSVEDAWQIAVRGLGLDEQRIEDAWVSGEREFRAGREDADRHFDIAERALQARSAGRGRGLAATPENVAFVTGLAQSPEGASGHDRNDQKEFYDLARRERVPGWENLRPSPEEQWKRANEINEQIDETYANRRNVREGVLTEQASDLVDELISEYYALRPRLSQADKRYFDRLLSLGAPPEEAAPAAPPIPEAPRPQAAPQAALPYAAPVPPFAGGAGQPAVPGVPGGMAGLQALENILEMSRGQ